MIKFRHSTFMTYMGHTINENNMCACGIEMLDDPYDEPKNKDVKKAQYYDWHEHDIIFDDNWEKWIKLEKIW